MKDFSEKIKKALKEKKMTKGTLCEKIGMSIDGFKSMEDNNTIKVITLEKICEVLELPMTYFLEIEEPKIEPVGFWKKMIQDMSDELNQYRMRAYRAEELLNKNGIVNFNYVSERRGVIMKTKNRKPIFFRPTYLRFHLQK